MTDHPILFSAPMVRALLAGTKTQTRRVIKWQGPKGYPHSFDHAKVDNPAGVQRLLVPYNHPDDAHLPWGETGYHRHYGRADPGDRLWVREAFLPDPPSDADAWDDWSSSYVEWSGTGCKASEVPLALRRASHVIYRADPKWDEVKLRFTIGRFMPRWASRLTLHVTEVRVQRLQEISAVDEIAEGIDAGTDEYQLAEFMAALQGKATPPEVACYAQLWNRINGPGAWDANPWVTATTFSVSRGNIDA